MLVRHKAALRSTRTARAGFLLYFTAASRQHGCQCIGVARSRRPLGPYEHVSDEPLVAVPEQGGAIDPSAVTAPDGRCGPPDLLVSAQTSTPLACPVRRSCQQRCRHLYFTLQ